MTTPHKSLFSLFSFVQTQNSANFSGECEIPVVGTSYFHVLERREGFERTLSLGELFYWNVCWGEAFQGKGDSDQPSCFSLFRHL